MLGTALPGRTLGDEKLVPTGLPLFTASYVPIFAVVGLLLYLFYKWALPKPIPGIPYNVEATKHILGDIPSVQEAMKRTGEFNAWINEQTDKFADTPIFQVFIRPLGKPLLILSDFREAQDILLRRKEFDRSSLDADLLEGAGRNHHIHLKTGDKWKRHRRLLQDLMSPQFLNEVAAPTVYAGASRLIQLWNNKARIAEGRPFSAESDIYYGSLDAVLTFTFGSSFASSALRPTSDLIQGLGAEDIRRLRGSTLSSDAPLEFPTGDCDEKIHATLGVADSIEYLQGSPIPRIKWWFVEKLPSLRRVFNVKRKYTREEIDKALKRLKEVGDEQSKLLSAVELIVLREKKLAESEGRAPDFFSEIIVDEIFGVVVAGHDTTSTTMCWGLKLFADNPQRQTNLREALRAAFPDAAAEKRSPTVKEITGNTIKVPYLDAAVEEILRCGGATPLVDREATCDTELLGHHIPKGTVVMCLNKSHSMMKPACNVDESLRSQSSQSAKARAWDDADIGHFKPERWLVESFSTPGGVEFDQQAGPQLAFGLGTRGCFGRRLGYLELRIILALIVWNFQLLPCPRELSGYGAKEGLTYKPKDCYVRLLALGDR
ncbi:cytochrome P450 [Colletotrichum orchidophilum]|uniref:Cytochrome P450 n=1 Tax=Colletotrichum orchidophilum TaxID=1209926 RepID=A0A1G4BK89_9PEZI|nr:cytochrome P450 [Colletotrichum orchidophilum]OHF01717.1 cytochrome P450 [Colletotrichum orchidophilum]